MNILVLPLVIVVLGGTLVAGMRFWFVETSRKLRIMFAALLVAGCVAAVWCTFFLEYQPSPTLRLRGFPVPLTVFRLQNGNWVNLPGMIIPSAIVDLVAVPSLTALPISLLLIVRAVRRHKSARRRGFAVIQNS